MIDADYNSRSLISLRQTNLIEQVGLGLLPADQVIELVSSISALKHQRQPDRNP